MQSLSNIKADFDALLNQYGGIPEDSGCYTDLWYLFLHRRLGKHTTEYEEMSNFPASEMAMMLKQLLCSPTGAFSLKVGSAKREYSNPTLVEVLKKSLVDALQAMVTKEYPLLNVTYGSKNDYLIGWDYPKGETPQEDGFSLVELDMIVEMGKWLKDNVKKLSGKSTRNPELGQLITDLSPNLPEGWTDATKNAFLADFLCGAGFLDFKGTPWLDGFKDMGKAEKDRMVRNWLESFRQAHLWQ